MENNILEIIIGKSQLDKHFKYKDFYQKNDLFFGLGIENEKYLEFENKINFNKQKFIKNRNRERYSVDYNTNYNQDIYMEILKYYADNIFDNQLPLLLNSHSFLETLNQDKIILIESAQSNFDEVKDLLKILSDNGKKVKLLVLDSIQSFQTPYTKNREEGIKELIQDLKILAIENEMVLLITSDVSRKVEYRGVNKIPTIDDMKVSRHIGYQSDFCFVMKTNLLEGFN